MAAGGARNAAERGSWPRAGPTHLLGGQARPPPTAGPLSAYVSRNRPLEETMPVTVLRPRPETSAS
jgi:hypothetical protein